MALDGIAADDEMTNECPALVPMDDDEDQNSFRSPLVIAPLIVLALQPSLSSEQGDSLELSPTTNTTTDFVSSTSCLLVLDNYIIISYKPLPIISVPFTSETLNEAFVAHTNSEVQSSTYDIYNI
jgi:hypothetical protein